jgi:AraC family transcriptional regulator, transcriptional activator of pobA
LPLITIFVYCMKKNELSPRKFASLTEAHRAFGLPNPKHPLITMLNAEGTNKVELCDLPNPHVLSFYKISYKPKLSGKLKYGQGYYDFDEGGLLFVSPGQIIGSKDSDGTVCSEYTLLIHPDFFLGYPLAKQVKQYGFFSYATNETLHLSEEEKQTVISIFRIMETELNGRIDDFSQPIVIAQIELLLNYADRFYKRQFITRKAASSDLLQGLEDLLNNYFNDEKALSSGLPTVSYLAAQLNLSPSYLGDMLRALTGQSAQQHIHDKLIEKAKEKLSATRLSVSEIAYSLGFGHSQSFSKLFKTKTNQSPLEFRQSFN